MIKESKHKKTIEEKGIKQTFLAKKLEISKVLLNYYLNGARPMPEHIDKGLKELLT